MLRVFVAIFNFFQKMTLGGGVLTWIQHLGLDLRDQVVM